MAGTIPVAPKPSDSRVDLTGPYQVEKSTRFIPPVEPTVFIKEAEGYCCTVPLFGIAGSLDLENKFRSTSDSTGMT